MSSPGPQADLPDFSLDNGGNGLYPVPPNGLWEEELFGRQTRMADQGSGIRESILQALPCGYMVVDSHGAIRALNPACEKLLSVEASQILTRPILEAVPVWQDTQLAKELPVLLAAIQSDGTTEFDLPAPNERWLRVCVSRVPASSLAVAWEGGLEPEHQEQALLLILAETTELVKLKQRLRMTEYQASIGKLARGIAHELNNPLDGVLRYTHLALEQLTEDTPVREYLIQVKEGLDRMVQAVRAFLEFARQATTPLTRLADLNRLIEDALVLFRHRAKFQHVRIVTQLDSGLPHVPDGGLQHGIVNLIKNAFDAMPHGGTLTVTTRRGDSQVDVEIEDTGTGIPEEIRSRIFEPFFSTKPLHQGTGLGLIIAKEVVERSGGSIEFTSQVGVGTAFRILLPITTQESDQNGP